ncbi:MAG: hypothetical protein OHK0046_15500 [Anaerolineae bacterium]
MQALSLQIRGGFVGGEAVPRPYSQEQHITQHRKRITDAYKIGTASIKPRTETNGA